MTKYLLDTNIIIRHLRKDPDFKRFVELYIQDEFVLSYVTIAELLYGTKTKRHKKDIEMIMQTFHIDYGSKTVNESTIELYKDYYLNKGMDFNDALIATLAIKGKYTLVSNNLKDYKFVDDLKVFSLRQLLKQ